MRLQGSVLIGIFMLATAAALPAQNTLPDPHNDSCWSDLGSLRACQLQAYNEEHDYDRRCTSYPEYQCAPPDYQPAQKLSDKQMSKVTKATKTAATSTATSSVEDDSATVLVNNMK